MVQGKFGGWALLSNEQIVPLVVVILQVHTHLYYGSWSNYEAHNELDNLSSGILMRRGLDEHDF